MLKYLSYFVLTLLALTICFGQSKHLEESQDSLKVISYIELIIKFNRSNYDSALLYARKAQSLSKEIGSQELLARSKYRLATVYINQNQTDLANRELDSLIEICNQIGHQKILSYAKLEKGRLSQHISNYDQAAIYFFEALRLAEELDDKNTQARTKNYLATVYNYQSQFDLSIKYYKEALTLVSELNFNPGVSAITTNLGDTYLSLKKYDSAIIYQQRALKIKKELGDMLGTGRVYNNLGNIFISPSPLQNLDSGLFYYQKGFEIANEVNNRSLKALCLDGFVIINFMKGNHSVAILKGEDLINEVELLQDLPLAIRGYDYLSLAYAANGDIAKSISYRERRNTLADSLLNSERIKLTQELEAKYQNEAQQKTIELQELQIAKNQNERNGLIILAFVILLILVLIINQYRIKQKTNQQLRELDRIKSTFFENLSHEFRTPLSLILAPIKDRMNQPLTKEDEVLYKTVIQNAENLDDLINELLDLAKLEKGNYDLQSAPAEASELFKVITASYESLATVKQISYETDIPDKKKWLELDKDLLRKICNNLLSNAFKFTPSGGKILFKVSFDATLEINVSDNGPGIPSKDRKHIFDRFYQVGGPHANGTGIGLALTKELVGAAGGNIELEDNTAKGASFIISMPVKSVEPKHAVDSVFTPEKNGLPIAHTPTFSDEKLTLLIIEDNEDLRNYVSKIFEGEFNICVGANGIEGINIATETIPDLIISDIMMEEMDGLEVCKQLKGDERTDHIPIILLTARADQPTKLKGLSEGADAYILKPFESEELKVTGNNLIFQRQKLRDKYLSIAKSDTKVEDIHPFIAKCEQIIHEHLSNDTFSANDFAKALGMSRMQVHRKLKAITDLSATAFVRNYRLGAAKSLLEKGEPVSQVAYAVGFSNLPYFTKTFKEKYGLVPSELVKK